MRKNARKAGFNTCAAEVSRASVGEEAVFSILTSSPAPSVLGGGAALYMAGAATKPCTFTGKQRVGNCCGDDNHRPALCPPPPTW